MPRCIGQAGVRLLYDILESFYSALAVAPLKLPRKDRGLFQSKVFSQFADQGTIYAHNVGDFIVVEVFHPYFLFDEFTQPHVKPFLHVSFHLCCSHLEPPIFSVTGYGRNFLNLSARFPVMHGKWRSRWSWEAS